MKLINTLSIFAIALFCLFGCKDSNDPEPDGKKNDPTQKNENIASTNIISKDISLDNYTGIVLDMDGDLILATGEDEEFSITIEGPDNVVEAIKADIDNKNLTFSSDSTFTGEYNVKFHISMPSVGYISIKGKSSLTNKKKSMTFGYDSKLQIEIDGEAQIDLDVFSVDMETIIGGTADIYYTSIYTSNHLIRNYGNLSFHGLDQKTTNTEIYTSRTSVTNCELLTDQLIISGYGSGTIKYTGLSELNDDYYTGDVEFINLDDE